MKPATPLKRGLLSHLPSALSLSLGIAAFGSHGQAIAEAVDSELVLLVDITKPGPNNKDFSSLMDSYASSITSSELMDQIQSGANGRIAVSLMFFGDSTTQQVGIPWMSIGSAAEATQFATLIDGLSAPSSAGGVDLAAGLIAAAGTFGSETGNTGNGFESALQIIDVAATNTPKAKTTGDVTTARNQILASGVDLINTIAVAKKPAKIADYYATNVIGTTLTGVTATATSSEFGPTLTTALNDRITTSLESGATAVPEPSASIGLAGILLILFRRRRN